MTAETFERPCAHCGRPVEVTILSSPDALAPDFVRLPEGALLAYVGDTSPSPAAPHGQTCLVFVCSEACARRLHEKMARGEPAS